MNHADTVIVAGAGPVGLAAALTLAQAGVAVRVFEKRTTLNLASRASTWHPATLDVMQRIGVVEPLIRDGVRVDRIQYRDVFQGVFAEFDLSLLTGMTQHPFRIHFEQSAITPVMVERVRSFPNCRVDFDTEVLSAEESEDGIVATIRSPDGVDKVKGSYLVVAEGARSVLRDRAGISFNEESYGDMTLRLVTEFDLATLFPGIAPISYLYNGQKTVSFLKMPGVWRIILRVPPATSQDEALDPAWFGPRLREVLPMLDAPPPLVSKDTWTASKAVADTFKKGRLVIVGDAAHLTNTRGGMNMNCGIHEAYEIGRAIARAIANNDDAPVEAAARHRHRIVVNEVIRRTDKTVTGGASWLDDVRAASDDPTRARSFLHAASMLDIAPQA